MTDALPRDFYLLVYMECAALIWSQDMIHALCAKPGRIFVLFVGIMNESVFWFFFFFDTLLTVRYVGKENISKQHDAIPNTIVTKDASGTSKFLILRSILNYIFKSLKLSTCRNK